MSTRGARMVALTLLGVDAVLIAYAILIAFSASWRFAAVIFAAATLLGALAAIFLAGAALADMRARRRRDGR